MWMADKIANIIRVGQVDIFSLSGVCFRQCFHHNNNYQIAHHKVLSSLGFYCRKLSVKVEENKELLIHFRWPA